MPRIINAILLRREFYEAVAADPHATGPAAGIVCLTALARESFGLASMAQLHPIWGLAALSVVIVALAAWLLYGAFAYAVARLLAPGPVEFRRVLRCLGFAETVTILRLIAFLVQPGFLPPSAVAPLAWTLHVVLLAWGFAAVFVAMRAAAPAPPLRVLLITVPTFVAQQAVLAVGRAVAY